MILFFFYFFSIINCIAAGINGTLTKNLDTYSKWCHKCLVQGTLLLFVDLHESTKLQQ
ncbi:hypothetical protein AAHE18_02G109700 [Arachis hypogaea]